MSLPEPASARRPLSRRTWLLFAATGAILLVAANAHLVFVAITSQPGCVSHQKPGGDPAQSSGYGAARSSC